MNLKKIGIHLLAITFVGGALTACSSKKKKEEKPAPKIQMAQEEKADISVKVVEKAKNEAPHWGYDGLFGPNLWGNLDPAFSACKDGVSQSPIDLVFKRPTSTENVDIMYKSGPLAIADTGHSLLATGTKGSIISIGGDIYNLVQLHFHTPSEHTLSGKQYAAELHFVHKNQAGQLLYLSVLFNEGPPNPVVDQIVKNVPTTKRSQKSRSRF
ncbi:MAG: carbonic anhydrase family protein [Bdellovibrionales bacterium]